MKDLTQKTEKVSKDKVDSEKEVFGPIGAYGIGDGLAVYLAGATSVAITIVGLYEGMKYLVQ